MKTSHIVLIILGIIVLALGLGWVAQGNDFFLYKVFAPKYEQVRRETFEQSKAYKTGMIQELQNLQIEYLKADESHKQALATIIIHRVAEFDETQLPADLHDFIEGLKRERDLAK